MNSFYRFNFYKLKKGDEVSIITTCKKFTTQRANIYSIKGNVLDKYRFERNIEPLISTKNPLT